MVVAVSAHFRVNLLVARLLRATLLFVLLIMAVDVAKFQAAVALLEATLPVVVVTVVALAANIPDVLAALSDRRNFVALTVADVAQSRDVAPLSDALVAANCASATRLSSLSSPNWASYPPASSSNNSKSSSLLSLSNKVSTREY
jgi:hypothetical protein